MKATPCCNASILVNLIMMFVNLKLKDDEKECNQATDWAQFFSKSEVNRKSSIFPPKAHGNHGSGGYAAGPA